jgi:protein-S-isoprenylcysteine O-methyltransferase Ste14
MPENLLRIFLFSSLILIILVWFLVFERSINKFINIFSNRHGQIVFIIALTMILQISGLISNLKFWPDGNILSLIGIIIYFSGLTLAIWAKLTMKMNWGMPAQHNIKKQNNLVQSGPYRISRNPIYLGFILFFAGFEIAMQSWFIVLVIPLFIYVNKVVTVEEQLLEKYFGNEFLEYKKLTRKYL